MNRSVFSLVRERRIPPRLSRSEVDRFRRLVYTSRRAQTLVAACVSLVAGITVARGLGAADSAADAWTGEVRAVATRHRIERGATLTLDDLVDVMLPPALAPDEVVTEVTPGMRVQVDLPARTILVAPMLEGTVDYPSDWRVVAFPPGADGLPMSAGDRLDIVAGTNVLVEGAVVATVSPLTLAVPADLAAPVAAAVRLGDVSLVGR